MVMVEDGIKSWLLWNTDMEYEDKQLGATRVGAVLSGAGMIIIIGARRKLP